MFDVDALRQIFSLQSAAWTFTAIAFLLAVRVWNGAPSMFQQWISWQQTKGAAKSADWSRLRGEISRLDERCDHLQTEVDECRKREGEWMQRAIAAESFQLGEGEALQQAQRIVSTERQIDKERRGDGNG